MREDRGGILAQEILRIIKIMTYTIKDQNRLSLLTKRIMMKLKICKLKCHPASEANSYYELN